VIHVAKISAMAKQTSNDLLKIADPAAWQAWLFHIQTNLINYGYVETLGESGKQQFTANMQGLYDFFGDQLLKSNKE
jgi:hypothetical protein